MLVVIQPMSLLLELRKVEPDGTISLGWVVNGAWYYKEANGIMSCHADPKGPAVTECLLDRQSTVIVPDSWTSRDYDRLITSCAKHKDNSKELYELFTAEQNRKQVERESFDPDDDIPF